MSDIISAIEAVSYNIYWVSALFVSCALLLHVLFIVHWPLSLQRWKQSEYIWIVLTFISVLGLVEESRRLNLKQEISRHDKTVVVARDSVHNWYMNYQTYSCVTEPNTVQCAVMSDSLKGLNLLIASSQDHPEIPVSFLLELNSINELVSPSVYQVIYARLNKYSTARMKYLAFIASARRSYARQIIVALTPLLFIFGLAIKLTKVTAEYARSNN